MKTLYYYTDARNVKALKKAVSLILDGKNAARIWTPGRVLDVDAIGGIIAEEGAAVHHADAVKIRPGMSEKEAKNAHRIAAMRTTIREKEERAAALLSRGQAMTAEDRAALLSLVNVAYHEGGKIDGVYSVDSTAACEFCARMRAAAEENALIICGSCYAAADAYKEAAWRTHKLNALILSTVLFTRDELLALNIPGPRCRFNEDGDTVNITMGRNYLRIAAGRPGVHFGYWYKNRPAVEAALKAEGYRTRAQLPENVRFGHSSVLIGIPAEATWFDDFVFTVYPDAETTAAAIAAGAHECNGRKCRACDYTCYMMARRPDAPLQVAEILRAGKDVVKATRAALDAYKARR